MARTKAPVYPLKLLSSNVGGNNFADKFCLADYEITLQRQSSLRLCFLTRGWWRACESLGSQPVQGFISSAARSVPGEVTCFTSEYFPPRPDALLVICASYLCEKSAQGAKSCLLVYIQLCGFGGFFFGLFSCIGQTFCTKHKVNGMTSPGQNPRFRLCKRSFVIY